MQIFFIFISIVDIAEKKDVAWMATDEVFISWKSWNIYKKYNKICANYAQIYALLHIFQSLMGPNGVFTGVILDPGP